MATFETGRILTAARFGLVAALATLLVSSVPYMFGFLATPPDRVYLGLMFDAPDHAQYWSWVTASRDGLFIPNTMTPEPNAANFLNPIMWALAKLQAIFNLSFAALFQWWRLAAAIVMGPALAVATALLSRGGAQARTAFWIALLGGGVGWTLVVVKYALGSPDVPFPQAVYTVEPNTWFGLLGYPYMPLAQGLVLTALAGAFLAHVRGVMWAHVACALGAAGTALVHAYDLVIVYVVLGASWGLEVWRTRQIPRGLTVAIAIAVGASAPLALYYQRLTSTDPLWQAVLAQYVNAGVWTPNPPLLVVLLGAPLLLALWRLAAGLNWSDPGLRFTACWVVAGTVLAYAPTVFQVKLLAALHVPLAILAADVWHERAAPWIVRLVKRAGAAGVASWAPAVVLAALVLPTNLYLFAWRLVELRRPDSSYYLTVDEAAALEALAARSGPDDVALALEDVGRWIPNYGRTRAFLAHWSMTNRYLQRRDDVAMFFSTRVDDAWRARLLAQDRVTFVVWTARRAAEGLTYDPASSPLFEPLFVSKTAGVFRVRGD
jgi:predicted membrane channel-forming protein YqfA (hemolysin III family)